MMIFKHAVLLFKVWNEKIYLKACLALNFQQDFNERNDSAMIFETSKLKVGKHFIANRLKIIISLIKYKWLNLSLTRSK